MDYGRGFLEEIKQVRNTAEVGIDNGVLAEMKDQAEI